MAVPDDGSAATATGESATEAKATPTPEAAIAEPQNAELSSAEPRSDTAQLPPPSIIPEPSNPVSPTLNPTTPIQTPTPTPETSSSPEFIGEILSPSPDLSQESELVQNQAPRPNAILPWVAVAALSTIAAGWAAMLLAKVKGKNKTEDNENNPRCLNLKELMEQKLKEFTDLKGQLRAMGEEKARDALRQGVAGTRAGDLLALIESAEKEYNRLKQLYEECIMEPDKSRRVFIVHGWDGHPQEGWFPWLAKELASKGFKVTVPQLPDAGSPRINKWIPALAKAVGEADANTYFVGHSMGCQAIARYLETLPKDSKVGGAVFVAGFFGQLTNLEDDDEVRSVADEWLKAPLNFEKIKAHLPKSVAIFSDDDSWVPLGNQIDFKEKLGSLIITEHAKGHFSGTRDGAKELAIARDNLLELAK